MHKIDTQLPSKFRSDVTSDEPQSVIHVPTSFKTFDDTKSSYISEAGSSEATVVSPTTPEAAASPNDKVSVSASAWDRPS